MSERAELLQAALETLPEAVLLLDAEERAVFWNHAAETLTGYAAGEVIGRTLGPELTALTDGCSAESDAGRTALREHAAQTHVRHKNGTDLLVMARLLILRDGLGRRIGRALLFHSGEHGNALPHSDSPEDEQTRESIEAMEERVDFAYQEFAQEFCPLGILWISVDQAHELRKTHGMRACETMLAAVERTLANGLKPGEEIGRWGESEFLVLAHEQDPHKLDAHARVLAGLARTADFRWWGDRVSLTVSVGSAVATPDEPMHELLAHAQRAMLASANQGGNRSTPAAGGAACSRSSA